MKKLFILVLLFSSSVSISAQDCVSPLPYTGNTGANMTAMLTPSFISSLDITDPSAYVVATTDIVW